MKSPRKFVQPPAIGSVWKLNRTLLGASYGGHNGGGFGLGKGTRVVIIEHTNPHTKGYYGPGCKVKPHDPNHEYSDKEFYICQSDLYILVQS